MIVRFLKIVLISFVMCFLFILGSAGYFVQTITDKHADVAIVCGAALDPSTGQLSSAGQYRVSVAADLYHAGQVRYVLISGGIGHNQPSAASQMMHRYAVHLGVPAEHILIEPRSRTTFENARFSIEMLRENNLQSAILVTSAFHMPRTRLLFWVFDEGYIVGVLGANDLANASWSWSLTILLRETLAYPFNAAKLAGWWLSGQLGMENFRESYIR